MSHEHGMYGYFPGGDPRKFTPDGENSEKEHATWKAACEAFAKTGEPHDPGCFGVSLGTDVSAIVTTGAGFGPGVYSYDCDDPSCPEAQAETWRDPDDAYAAFERWFEWDGKVIEAQTDETLQEKMREAFAAGFKARQELEGGDE